MTAPVQTKERFIVVVTAHGEEVESYLYSHTTVVRRIAAGDGIGSRTHFLLRTVSDGNIDYLVNYQADRLSSGLHSAKVYDTEAEAIDAHRERFGVNLGRDHRIAIVPTVHIEISVADYTAAYGLAAADVQNDAFEHLSQIAFEAVREAAAKLGYVTDVRLEGSRVYTTRYE